MAQLNLSLLVLLLSIVSMTVTATPAYRSRSRVKAFIEAECRITRYPQTCVQFLSSSINPNVQTSQQLAQIALLVSLTRARYTKAYVNKVAADLKVRKAREYQAVKDCLEQITDGVDQLTQSLKELRRIDQDGDVEFIWHTSNVQSWVSTALTDVTTCLDGLSGYAMGGKDKAIIKAKVLNVAQVTSNALAFFNRFAARHRARGVTVKPKPKP